ncbi:MAG TPA: hypothetical protein VF177_01800 [Anaerolineae bacterium]
MSDLQEYIEKRKIRDAEFGEDFEKGYASFKLGVLLRQAREAAGLSQEDIAWHSWTFIRPKSVSWNSSSLPQVARRLSFPRTSSRS